MTAARSASASLGTVSGEAAELALSGDWTLSSRLPRSDETLRALDQSANLKRLSFDTSGVTAWDSALASFLSASTAPG